MPESRVFRPRSETEDRLIDSLIKVRVAEGAFPRPSWTSYVSYLLNKEAQEIRGRHKARVKA